MDWTIFSVAVIVLSAILGTLITIFAYAGFLLRLNLRIIPRWENEEMDSIILRLEIENYSKIVVIPEKMRLQILEYETIYGCLSEVVPFDRENPIYKQKLKLEPPLMWKEPIPLFGDVTSFFPGETVTGERMHYWPRNSILQVGLMVDCRPNWFARLANLLTNENYIWTTSIIVVHKDRRIKIVPPEKSLPTKKT